MWSFHFSRTKTPHCRERLQVAGVSTIRIESTREESAELNPSRGKSEGACRSSGGGIACYVTPDLSYDYGGSRRKKGEDGMGGKKTRKHGHHIVRTTNS